MGDCTAHNLIFGPHMRKCKSTDLQTVSNIAPSVADLECPCCGQRLSIYYCVDPKEGPQDGRKSEGGTQ